MSSLLFTEKDWVTWSGSVWLGDSVGFAETILPTCSKMALQLSWKGHLTQHSRTSIISVLLRCPDSVMSIHITMSEGVCYRSIALSIVQQLLLQQRSSSSEWFLFVLFCSIVVGSQVETHRIASHSRPFLAIYKYNSRSGMFFLPIVPSGVWTRCDNYTTDKLGSSVKLP